MQRYHHMEHDYEQLHHYFQLMVKLQRSRFKILEYQIHFAYHFSLEPRHQESIEWLHCLCQQASYEK